MIPVPKTGTPRDSSLTPTTIMVVDTMELNKSRSLLKSNPGTGVDMRHFANKIHWLLACVTIFCTHIK